MRMSRKYAKFHPNEPLSQRVKQNMQSDNLRLRISDLSTQNLGLCTWIGYYVFAVHVLCHFTGQMVMQFLSGWKKNTALL